MRTLLPLVPILLLECLAQDQECGVDGLETAAKTLVAKHQSEALEEATRRCFAAGDDDSAANRLRENYESDVCPRKWAVT